MDQAMSETSLPSSLPPRRRGFAGDLAGAFLLRDDESWARKLDDADRQILFTQVARARQKLESAKLLWAHEQYVEGLRLAAESVNETLRAAELGDGVLSGGFPESESGTARPPWAEVLLALGATPDEIDEAVVAAGGPHGVPPAWNGDLRPEHRRYFRGATRVTESALERLSPLVTAPRKIVMARWLRILGVLGVLAAAWFTIHKIRTAVEIRASAHFSPIIHGAKNLLDGDHKSEWLLPNAAKGHVELTFRPRRIKAIKILNARNAPFLERGTHELHVEAFLDKKQIHTAKHKFDKFDEKPVWLTIPMPDRKVDSIKIFVDSHFKNGGGFAELELE